MLTKPPLLNCMKTRYLALLLILPLFVGLNACKGLMERNAEEAAAKAAEEDGFATEISDEIIQIIEEAEVSQEAPREAGRMEVSYATIGNCATITRVSRTDNSRELTIDFGTTNCQGADAKSRRGKIIARYTGNYFTDGLIANVSFEDYFVNDHQVTGTKTINRGLNGSNGFPTKQVNADLNIRLANNGGTLVWRCDRSREWIAGSDTPFVFSDDTFRWNGVAILTSSNGRTATATIDRNNPLIKTLRIGCARTFVSGVINFNFNNSTSASIDYGDGTCNRTATITVNGKSREVIIRQ